VNEEGETLLRFLLSLTDKCRRCAKCVGGAFFACGLSMRVAHVTCARCGGGGAGIREGDRRADAERESERGSE